MTNRYVHGERRSKTLIIGLGNVFRSDDSAGLVIIRRLRDRLFESEVELDVALLEQSGEGAALIEAWKGYERVYLVDAVSSGAEPGTIHQFDAVAGPIPAQFCNYSSHAFGAAEAVELARQLDRLPPSLDIYGIEGQIYTYGQVLSPAVDQAANALVQQIFDVISRQSGKKKRAVSPLASSP